MDVRKSEGGERSGESPHSVQSRHQLKKTNMGRRRYNGAGLQSSLHRCRDYKYESRPGLDFLLYRGNKKNHIGKFKLSGVAVIIFII